MEYMPPQYRRYLAGGVSARKCVDHLQTYDAAVVKRRKFATDRGAESYFGTPGDVLGLVYPPTLPPPPGWKVSKDHSRKDAMVYEPDKTKEGKAERGEMMKLPVPPSFEEFAISLFEDHRIPAFYEVFGQEFVISVPSEIETVPANSVPIDEIYYWAWRSCSNLPFVDAVCRSFAIGLKTLSRHRDALSRIEALDAASAHVASCMTQQQGKESDGPRVDTAKPVAIHEPVQGDAIRPV